MDRSVRGLCWQWAQCPAAGQRGREIAQYVGMQIGGNNRIQGRRAIDHARGGSIDHSRSQVTSGNSRSATEKIWRRIPVAVAGSLLGHRRRAAACQTGLRAAESKAVLAPDPSARHQRSVPTFNAGGPDVPGHLHRNIRPRCSRARLPSSGLPFCSASAVHRYLEECVWGVRSRIDRGPGKS